MRKARGVIMTTGSNSDRQPAGQRPRRVSRDAVVGIACGVGVALMVGAAFAAVPFYNWFCRTTGFNGTTQVATARPAGARA